ncbi:MAG: Ig domain-containing protein [Planctomycetota bacterium]|jgi:hypothetical protein
MRQIHRGSFSLAWVFSIVAVSALAGCAGEEVDRFFRSPTIVTQPVITATAGTQYVYGIGVDANPDATITATGDTGALPSWLSVSGATLFGTPSAADVGSHAVRITADNGTDPADTQVFTIVVSAAPAGTTPGGTTPGGTTPGGSTAGPLRFSEDFESGAASWTISLPAGTGSSDWEVGTPTVGPGSAFQGTGCAGTVLTGDYVADPSGGRLNVLQTPVIDMSGLSDPAIKFQHFYGFEPDFDGGNLKISSDGGATFVSVDNPELSVPYNSLIDGSFGNPLDQQDAYSGQIFNWEEVEITLLPAQATAQVVLRFEFGADDSVTMEGWFIDEVHAGERSSLP